MTYTITTLAERPDLADEVYRLNREAWPTFMRHDPVADEYWDLLLTDFAAFQLFLCDAAGAVLALGMTIPVVWDGTLHGLPEGWDAVLMQGVHDRNAGRAPTVLSALAAIVSPGLQGSGLSRGVLEAMKGVAAAHGLNALIAPVRPSLKHRYPLTPIERYAAWTNDDGLPFDPWLRVHRRLGAQFLQVAPRSMVIPGTVAEWEAWTAMRFPESGAYIVPHALVPVEIDENADKGEYVEPNVWMLHQV